MIYIGIDPGKSGGIAGVTTGGHVLDAIKMPETERGVLNAVRWLEAMRTVEGPPFAVLERVSASPQMGVTSAFTFGKGYGALTMALTAAEIPFDLVSPQRWQTVMGCLSKGDKNVTKRRAEQLFPHLKTITHAIADALLLAEYCRRIREHSNGKEEAGAQPTSEAPGGDRPQTQREPHERQRATRTTRAAEKPALAAAARHGAGARRKTGQHL